MICIQNVEHNTTIDRYAAIWYIPRGKDYIYPVLPIQSIGSASYLQQKHGVQ